MVAHLTLTRVAAAAVLGITLATTAQAEVEGLEIIAPAGPGGGYDQLARATQQVLESEDLASDVQVLNVPGAGGTIGLAQFVTGGGRGTKAMVTGLGMIGAIKVNNSPIGLDQVTPLARMTGEYQPLVVAADSPIQSLDDLAEMYKADPGSVSWGGFALGSPDHLVSAMTVKAMGGDVSEMNYIVAGAGGEMLSQVVGGHITVATGGLNEFADLISTGRLRALAISSPERLPGVDIPTFKEQGYEVELVNWRGLMAQSSADEDDVQALDEAITAMVATEAWQTIAAERGWVDMHLNAADFAGFLESEQPNIEAILADLGLAE